MHLYLVRDVDVCTHLVAQRRVGAHQVVGFNIAHTKPEGNLKEYQTCPGDYVQFESAISLAHIVTLSLPHQYPLSIVSVISQCHPSAFSVPSHCHLTAISLPSECHLNTIPSPSHHPLSITLVSSQYHLYIHTEYYFTFHALPILGRQ